MSSALLSVRLVVARAEHAVALRVAGNKVVKSARCSLRWALLTGVCDGAFPDVRGEVESLRRSYASLRKSGLPPARLAVIARYGRRLAAL